MRLNLGYNKLSTLDKTVMPQLAKVGSSVDLNGNPWVCDCLMFDTIYSWCRNNSLDLKLVCSSPPKFKGHSWTIFENLGCDVEFADRVENITNVNYTLSPESVAKYLDFFSPLRKQVPPVKTNLHYSYISIALIVVFPGLLAVAAIQCWCVMRSGKFRRSGPAHSDAKTHRLSSSNT
jgi:hypothetical protein